NIFMKLSSRFFDLVIVKLLCCLLSLSMLLLFIFLILLRPPKSTLFPYTTLFRSWHLGRWADQLACIIPLMSPELGRALGPTKLRSEEHTSELQSQSNLVCRLLLEKKKK